MGHIVSKLSCIQQQLISLGSPENFDLCHQSLVTLCGVPININRDDATFELDIEQYLWATKSSELFPTRCLIPVIAKFKKYKPIPAKGKSIAITGFLTGLERNDDKTVKQFVIDIDNVTFFGPQGGSTTPMAEPEESLNKIGFFGSQGSSWEEPAQKKLKTADDRALEEADDKGERPSTGRSSRRAPRDSTHN
ncbi:hypothetical protein B0H19DRAFT_1086174 [Mycena capillaripes]|nr:hypothetical protein B0H19DRAFT_1086174 [Mycena capillaripes]